MVLGDSRRHPGGNVVCHVGEGDEFSVVGLRNVDLEGRMQPDEEFQPIQLIEIHLILNRLVGDHVAALDFGCDVLRCTRLSRRRGRGRWRLRWCAGLESRLGRAGDGESA